MNMQFKTKESKWLFKQFTIINRTATTFYQSTYGGIEMNFYSPYCEYEKGIFGWIKEKNSFETAMVIYEQYTANDGWDIINQLQDEFGDYLQNIGYEEIAKMEDELYEFEL